MDDAAGRRGRWRRAKSPPTPGLVAVTRGAWAGFVVLFFGDLATLYRGRGSGLVLYWVAALGYAVAGHRAAAASPGAWRVAARDGAVAAVCAYALTVPLRVESHSGVSALGTALAVAVAAAVGAGAAAIAGRAGRPQPGAAVAAGGGTGATQAAPGAAAPDDAAVPPAAPRAATAAVAGGAPVSVAGRWPVVRELLVLPDGRRLQWIAAGPPDGLPLVFHHASPGSAGAWRGAVGAAAGRGLRLVTYSRPGYAASTACPDRRVVDTAADVAALLDALGAERFATVGWAGGAAHALACAARLGDRCEAAAVIAALAPRLAFGHGWFDGMHPDAADELHLAVRGRAPLSDALGAVAGALAGASTDRVADAMEGGLAEVDQRALAGPFADYLAATIRAGVAAGVDGWVDDHLAAAGAWGFDLVEVGVPVRVVVGADDRVAPPAHSRWLAKRLPAARLEVVAGGGHLSVVATAVADFAGELAAEAGR
ncbi:MAG TPA: alpha/beta fold hydrolase [Acidimicrobiales bacterium]|nr:alpha/beta fold hydrolase [Acidimicrobiales bacterium]